jgi:hypothetical protein
MELAAEVGMRYWSDFHGWLYIISELMIWLAYFLIPLIMLNYIFRKKAALKFNTRFNDCTPGQNTRVQESGLPSVNEL